MASSFSTDLKLELMVTGENSGTWGTKTNTNLNLLQQAIAGFQSISIAGGPQTTALAMDNAAISNARNAVIKLTGTITGNQIVTVPNGIEKTYIIENGTTGAFTVEFKTAGGTGVTFATTDKSTKILFVDGTNVIDTGTVSLTGVQTLTNKTLTEPKIVNGGFIADANGNEQIKFTTTASAVNELTVINSATGSAPDIQSTGDDTNIDLKITPKGTGKIILDGLSFPNADGSANQVLQPNGSGVLAFATVSGGAAWQAVKSGNFNASAKEGYFVNTTSGAITATLPASPTLGDFISFIDYAGTFDTNNLTIGRNGKNIQGDASDLTVSVERAGLTLIFTDNTQGWLLLDK